VCETRVKLENFSKVANCMIPGWEVINNYSKHCLGKIWICWDPGGVWIDVVDVHAQVITCRVTSPDSGVSWMLSCIWSHSWA
jgi:hypothetical protein